MKKHFLFWLILLTINKALASETLYANCGKRLGQRISLESGKIINEPDSDSAYILFAFDSGDPDKLILFWDREQPISSSSKTTRTFIMHVTNTDDQSITAFDQEPGTTHLYTLYPKKGKVLHSMHKEWKNILDDGGPVSVSFEADCKFTTKK